MVDGNPLQFAAENIRLIRHYWAGVRDGDAESIHEARVATRRVRAALKIVDGKKTERLELCRRLGRMLGRVREVDVTQDIFRSLSTRVPSASSAMAAAVRKVEHDQHEARRRFAKQLDDLELKPLATVRERPAIAVLTWWKDWPRRVIAETLGRQQTLRDAVDRAPTVYMPNRVHRVRIATKKLRYTLEVAAATGVRVDATVIRDLRKTQDLLGQIHDIDVARRVVRQLDGAATTIDDEVAILDAVLGAECAAFHDGYLARRERLRAACDYCARLAATTRGSWPVTLAKRTLPTAGLVAVPVAVWRLAERKRSHA